MNRAIVAVGLQFGDETKGACTDFLCRDLNADLVVRYSGGAQAGHNVVTADGRSHCFSQWGSGTLRGVRTYLDLDMIVSPMTLAAEAAHLVELGVEDPYSMLTVHPNCIITTPTHRAANIARERARGENRHGSCGLGIGEARRFALGSTDSDGNWLAPDAYTIHARDLKGRPFVRQRIEKLRQYYLREEVLKYGELFELPSIQEEADRLIEAFSRVQIGPPPECDTAIFEGAQGVLLDERFGFHPYTTWSTVTASPAYELISKLDVPEVHTIGVMRAYTTRHGAGPLPSAKFSPFPNPIDPHNPENEHQGSMRFGALDLKLLRYALQVCPVDGLAINCIDQLDSNTVRYVDNYGPELRIPRTIREQSTLTEQLLNNNPEGCREMPFDSFLDYAAMSLGAKPWILGYGPTAADRHKTAFSKV